MLLLGTELNVWFALRIAFAIIVIWFVCLILPQLCTLRAQLLRDHYALPDLIHDYFPRVPVITPDAYIAFYFLLFWYYYEAFSFDLLWVWILGMIIRSVCVLLTTYPAPEIEQDSFGLHYTMLYDFMFSGHSFTYTVLASAADTPLAWLLCYIGCFLSAQSGQHYSSDCWVGHWIGVFLTRAYAYRRLVCNGGFESAELQLLCAKYI